MFPSPHRRCNGDETSKMQPGQPKSTYQGALVRTTMPKLEGKPLAPQLKIGTALCSALSSQVPVMPVLEVTRHGIGPKTAMGQPPKASSEWAVHRTELGRTAPERILADGYAGMSRA